MSTGTVVKDTSNQLNINIDSSFIFLGSNSYERATYANGTGSTVTMLAGTIMGRVSSSGLLLPLAIGATDGSQHFVGVLTETVTVINGDSKQVSLCIEGKVAQDKLVFNAAEDLESVVDGRQLKDIIAGQGIKLVATDELSNFDN